MVKRKKIEEYCKEIGIDNSNIIDFIYDYQFVRCNVSGRLYIDIRKMTDLSPIELCKNVINNIENNKIEYIKRDIEVLETRNKDRIDEILNKEIGSSDDLINYIVDIVNQKGINNFTDIYLICCEYFGCCYDVIYNRIKKYLKDNNINKKPGEFILYIKYKILRRNKI